MNICCRRVSRLALAILAVFVSISSLHGDVVESYEVGGPFDAGLISINPAPQVSNDNFFDSSSFFSGEVRATDARTIESGNGDVAFTGNLTGSLTQVEFDMGALMDQTDLANHVLLDSQVQMSAIESDADAGVFSFQFALQLFDGTELDDISEIVIGQSNGVFSVARVDTFLFEASLVSNTGPASIALSSASSTPLRSVVFRNITPDIETNVLRISGNRTLQFTAVPEPGSTVLIGVVLVLLATRRRRN